MYGPPGNLATSPFPPSFDSGRGPDAAIAAALQAAASTRHAAGLAQEAAAAAVPGQMPPWASTPTSSGMGYPASPKFMSTPSERPPGFLQASLVSKAPPTPKSSSQGKAPAPEGTAEKREKELRHVQLDDCAEQGDLAEDVDNRWIEPADSPSEPTKSQSLPNLPLEGGERASIGSAAHGSGECTPCAWFWKPDSCLNAQDCRYCHLCPDGELKKRKKQKVAKMRLGLVTPKAKSPVAHTLSLSSLI